MHHQVPVHEVHRIHLTAFIRAIRFPAVFQIGCSLSEEEAACDKNDGKEQYHFSWLHILTFRAITLDQNSTSKGPHNRKISARMPVCAGNENRFLEGVWVG